MVMDVIQRSLTLGHSTVTLNTKVGGGGGGVTTDIRSYVDWKNPNDSRNG